jgi:hypothetical protein
MRGSVARRTPAPKSIENKVTNFPKPKIDKAYHPQCRDGSIACQIVVFKERELLDVHWNQSTQSNTTNHIDRFDSRSLLGDGNRTAKWRGLAHLSGSLQAFQVQSIVCSHCENQRRLIIPLPERRCWRHLLRPGHLRRRRRSGRGRVS